MFLKSSQNLFDKNKIQGYKDRINDFIFSSLEIKNGLVPIIPVHSRAAFLSNQVSDKELKKQPSKQQIEKRIKSLLFARDLSLLVFAVLGTFANIIF